MRQFEDRVLSQYVLGTAKADVTRAIEQQCAHDAELRERVALRRFLADGLGLTESGAAEIEGHQPQVGDSVRRRFLRPRLLGRAAVVFFAMLALAGLSYGGWLVLTPKPLLEDRLQSRVFRSDLWKTPRPTVRARGGFLSLLDRGYLVTQREFAQPISIRFEWLWVEPAEGEPFAPSYSDILCVALRTQALPLDKHPFDIQDGVSVGFNASGNSISATEAPAIGPEIDTGPMSVMLPPDEWHEIRIDDDGTTIRVFIKGPQIDKRHWKEPVLQFKPSGTAKYHHVAVYNRELLAKVHHESRIRNFVILPLEK